MDADGRVRLLGRSRRDHLHGAPVITPDKVTAVLVTMGDVNLEEMTATMPPEFEIVVWNNCDGSRADYKVFGRYMGILEATRPVIWFQDDDCTLTEEQYAVMLDAYEPGVVTGNMIYEDATWRRRYHDMTLLGWGAIFDRDLPWKALMRFARYYPIDLSFMHAVGGAEIVFPMLSKCKTVVAGATWLGDPGQEVFGRSNRMSNQPNFVQERLKWLARAREVRDALAKAGA